MPDLIPYIYEKGKKLTPEGAAFEVKHEVGVHVLPNYMETAKGFVDGGIGGNKAEAARVRQLASEKILMPMHLREEIYRT